MTALLTEDEFKRALPSQLRKNVDKTLLDNINNTLSTCEERDSFRDNLLSYGSVMAQGKFKLSNYVDAVRYVSFKLLGATNIDAYMRTFPDKYQDFIDRGVTNKDIASYISAYNKSKLVGLIMEQTLVPSWVINQDMYQKALNVQAELMLTANSEKVRSDAANSILTHLKMPETQKVQLDIGIQESNGLTELKETMAQLAAQQRQALHNGTHTAQDVAHSKLVIEGEYEKEE